VPKPQKPYPPEFKQRIIEMVRAECSPDESAEKFDRIDPAEGFEFVIVHQAMHQVDLPEIRNWKWNASSDRDLVMNDREGEDCELTAAAERPATPVQGPDEKSAVKKGDA
jgi:hypothetical protein